MTPIISILSCQTDIVGAGYSLTIYSGEFKHFFLCQAVWHVYLLLS